MSDSSNNNKNSSVRRSSDYDSVRPESPLSEHEPRRRTTSFRRLAEQSTMTSPLSSLLTARTPSYRPPAPSLALDEVHQHTDRVVEVNLDEIEGNVRGGTPPSMLSLDHHRRSASLLNDSYLMSGGPRTSTPKKDTASKSHKSSRKTRGRKSESLYKKTLLKSAALNFALDSPAESSIDDSRAYRTAQESFQEFTTSPINEGYRSRDASQRALFAQDGVAPLERRGSSRSRSSLSSVPPPVCQLITPLAVHTMQEVNAVSATGQILIISHTLIRSARATSDIRRLMGRLAKTTPLISNEMSQVDIDYDNEQSKHEVFVNADAILIQRISTIHRGRDRNSFETDDRRTYRFVCEGDLQSERDSESQSKPRHLTIVSESSTNKSDLDIEKNERVVLFFDASTKPSNVVFPKATEISLIQSNDITTRPSSLKDSAVVFDEHVRVADNTHINITRKAKIASSARLWDEPLTEMREQRVYTQQVEAVDADCEPVRITRSHSLSRQQSRNAEYPRMAERSRTPSRDGSMLAPLRRSRTMERSHRQVPTTPEYRSRAVFDVSDDQVVVPPPRPPRLSSISPIPSVDRRAREHSILNRSSSADSAPRRRYTSGSGSSSNALQAPHQDTLRYGEDSSILHRQEEHLSRSRQPDASPITPKKPAIDEDTSAGSSQSPTNNRTPSTVSPHRLNNHVYRTPSKSAHRNAAEEEYDRMLDRTQPMSPAPSHHSLPLPSPSSSLRPSIHRRSRSLMADLHAKPATDIRPLGAAKSCHNLDGATPTNLKTGRRAVSDFSAFKKQAAAAVKLPPAPVPILIGKPASQPTTPVKTPSFPPRTALSASPLRPQNSNTRTAIPTSPFRSLPSDTRTAIHASPLRPQPSVTRTAIPTSPFRRPLSDTRTAVGASPLRPQPSETRTAIPSSPFRPLRSDTRTAIPTSPFRRPLSDTRTAIPASPLRPQPSNTRTAIPSSPFRPLSDNTRTAIDLSSQFRTQQYVKSSRSASADAVPVPRPRTKAPAPTVAPPAPAPRTRDFTMPSAKGKENSKGSAENVELVSNPEDFDKGEIMMKKLTLEAMINGHLWNLCVNFALKADRAALIKFQPKKVRIDDQLLWEDKTTAAATPATSQTNVAAAPGLRQPAATSSSLDSLLVPVSPSTLPPLAAVSTPTYTAKTPNRTPPPASPAVLSPTSSVAIKKTSQSQRDKKKTDDDSKKSKKSGEKSTKNTPFV